MLRANDFVLEAQSLSHTEADYAAVMLARTHLRRWSQSEWPEDSFSLEQNRADLAEHIADAESGFGYGYTVFSKEQTEVYGSVYLYPSEYFANRYALALPIRKQMMDAEIIVDYWLLPSHEEAAFHRRFSTVLIRWLAEKWRYQMTIWMTRPAMTERHQHYEQLGFVPLGMAESLGTPGFIQHFHQSVNRSA